MSQIRNWVLGLLVALTLVAAVPRADAQVIVVGRRHGYYHRHPYYRHRGYYHHGYRRYRRY